MADAANRANREPDAHWIKLHDGNYRIDRWDTSRFSRIIEEKALISDLYAARAAFDVLLSRYPDQVFTLRQRAHVIKEHPERPREPRPLNQGGES